MLLNFKFANGQNITQSKHDFSFYVNDVEQLLGNVELSIIVSNDTIKSKRITNSFYFPIIDTSKQFDILLKINGLTFSGQGYKAWVLNKGSKMTFGQITKLNKLESVAKYNGMTKKDNGWEEYSKRFFVINDVYTVEIDNRKRIHELQFLIVSPHNSNSLFTTQKTIK
ncbi:hypothetical protein GO621_18710 [Mucilaginibacter sp. HMF7410]|uniref:Uncharacterized protein n=2 Tax=Mucilaginibacter arboris TaxID=2682090 RepID=A0A7K1T1U3_9SPHI|nr:hypothetical protein [Mucilaginibacter arboris]